MYTCILCIWYLKSLDWTFELYHGLDQNGYKRLFLWYMIIIIATCRLYFTVKHHNLVHVWHLIFHISRGGGGSQGSHPSVWNPALVPLLVIIAGQNTTKNHCTNNITVTLSKWMLTSCLVSCSALVRMASWAKSPERISAVPLSRFTALVSLLIKALCYELKNEQIVSHTTLS